MKYLYLFSLVILASGCDQNTNHNSDSKKDTIVATPVDTSQVSNKAQLTVDAPSLYPQAFLDSLRNGKSPEPIHLSKNKVIVGEDTYEFPDDLVLNKPITLAAKKDSLFYELVLTRVNFVDINYTYRVTELDKVIFEESGLTRLQPFFFLGAESSEDEEGTSYLACEYLNPDPKKKVSMIDVSERTSEGLMGFAKGTDSKIFPAITLRGK